MQIDDSVWEHGSDYHLMDFQAGGESDLPEGADYYGSGRDAIRSLLGFGARQFGWKTVWIPSYFCQTVVRDIQGEGLDVRTYPDSPLIDSEEPIELPSKERGVVLTLNPFGLRSTTRPWHFDRRVLDVMEDHTHDPWANQAKTSMADFCVASLRKTVPIPDGGILWSPVGRSLPPCPEPTPIRMEASLRKLAGMTLKSRYLAGADASKQVYRDCLVAGENRIACGPVSGMPSHSRAILNTFPASQARRIRRANFERLRADLEPFCRILTPIGEEAVSYAAIVILETSEIRDRVNSCLVQQRIYPAILWSLRDPVVDAISPGDLQLSETMLAIHCDFRYSESDMDRVAKVLLSVLASTWER